MSEGAVAEVEVSSAVKGVLSSFSGMNGTDKSVLILEMIKSMTGLELVNASKLVEQKLDVKASGGGGFDPAMLAMMQGSMGAGGGAAAEDAGPKTYDVQLESHGDKKIGVIKAIRSLTGLGLKEAKDLVDQAPTLVKEGLAEEEANKYKAELEAAGATVKLTAK
jgi:large subunit ribosomal protein L7/L12